MAAEPVERNQGADGRAERPGRVGRRIAVRGLRRGDSGPAVRRLQERLAAMGYEPGPPDGIFGFLTDDALREFQRDFRLKVDGVAGQEVWNALDADLPKRRVVHVVQTGERLSDIAGRYDVSVPALRCMNGLHGKKRLQPGARIVIRSSYVLAAAARGASPRVLGRTLIAERKNVTALAAPPLFIGADGRPAEGADPGEMADFEALVGEAGWAGYLSVTGAEGPLGEIACRRKAGKHLLEAISPRARCPGGAGGAGGSAEGAAQRVPWGLILDVGPVPLGRGGRLAAWVERAAAQAGAVPIVLVLDVPVDGWRSFIADPDCELLSRAAHRIVIGAHRWESLLDGRGMPPSRERIERIVAAMARLVPPWKLLLGVPFNAWAITWDGGGEPVSYRTAVTEGYLRSVRPQKGEDGFTTFDFPRESGSRYARIVAPSRDVIERYIAIAHRFRLDGLYLSGVGEEDRRYWELLSLRIKAAQGE